MSTLLHLHVTCSWGDIPIGLGTSVEAFKPFVEACQTGGECINHLHHLHHSWITISTSWLLNSPIPFVISWSSWPLITCILQCPQLMTIWSGVSLKSTVMAGPFCDFGSDFPLASNLTTDWLQGLFNTRWSISFLFFSTFVVAIIGSLAFTNFTWRYWKPNYSLWYIPI